LAFFGQHDGDDALGDRRIGRLGRVSGERLVEIIDLEKDHVGASISCIASDPLLFEHVIEIGIGEPLNIQYSLTIASPRSGTKLGCHSPPQNRQTENIPGANCLLTVRKCSRATASSQLAHTRRANPKRLCPLIVAWSTERD
jgi:hypothetical protein